MGIYNEIPDDLVPPRLVLGNLDGGGMPLRGKIRMFRMGQRHLGEYEYDTLDLSKLPRPGGAGHGESSKHLTVDEIERFFDRAGKGKEGATITDPRMSTGAVVFMPMNSDDDGAVEEQSWDDMTKRSWRTLKTLTWGEGVFYVDNMTRKYFIRNNDNTISAIESGYRSWGMQDVSQDSVGLQLKLTQEESADSAYFDNSRFQVSNILWEFSPDGGRGKWYQLYELPNQKVRITLPEATQQIRLRAISASPDEWVQTVAVTPRKDFQNRYAPGLYWEMDGESTVPDDYIEFDDFHYLSWPKAVGGHGSTIYTLYWTPTEEMSDAVFLCNTKRNDLAPTEFELPVQYLGGYLHVFAQDMEDTLHIKKRFTASIKDCEVICEPDSMAYTGLGLEPSVTVRFKMDMAVLPPEFYDVEFVDNINVGTATVIVTGKDYYHGTPDEPGHFEVVCADVNDCDVALEYESVVFAEDDKEPAVSLTIGDFTVSPDDFEVTYSNNFNVGTATVGIVGTGNLSGERNISFEITKSPLFGIELEQTSAVYATTWEFPSATVYGAKGVVLDEDGATVGFVPSEISNVGEYEAVATGRGNYRGMISAIFTLEKATVGDSEIESIEDQWYTGDEIRPKPKVTRIEVLRGGTEGVRELVEGVDFYYTWLNNVIIGTGEVIITGMGNYEGQNSAEFNIVNMFGDGTWNALLDYYWGDLLNVTWGQITGVYE